MQAALDAFRSSTADFSDCLIASIAQSAGAAPLATFDEALSKAPATIRIGGRSPRRSA